MRQRLASVSLSYSTLHLSQEVEALNRVLDGGIGWQLLNRIENFRLGADGCHFGPPIGCDRLCVSYRDNGPLLKASQPAHAGVRGTGGRGRIIPAGGQISTYIPPNVNRRKTDASAGPRPVWGRFMRRVMDRPSLQAMLGMATVIVTATVTAMQAASPGGAQPAPGPLALHELASLGGLGSAAAGINDRGQVVGFDGGPDGLGRAVLWEGDRAIDLGLEYGSIVRNINNRGQIVGSGLNPPPVCDGSGLCVSFGRAFLWEAGTVTDLGSIGGHDSYPWDINNRGQVVGDAWTASGEAHAFLWDAGTMTDLGTLGGASSSAQAINDRGQVVGWSKTSTGVTHAFLWEAGTMTDLGAGDGSWSFASGINNRGQIVGGIEDHVLIWEAEKTTDLGTLGGVAASVTDINERGQLLVYVRDSAENDHMVLWEAGRITPLEAPEGSRTFAYHINDRGQAIGYCLPAGSMFARAVLWSR